MPLDDILLDCEESMEKTIEHLKHELRTVRTGRASPALVENIKVDYYGSPTELRAIAAISVPEATQLRHHNFAQPANQHPAPYTRRSVRPNMMPATSRASSTTSRP